MDRMQAPALEPAPDRPTAEPKLDQLLPGDDAVLALGQRGDRRVRATRPTLSPNIGLRCTRVADRAARPTLCTGMGLECSRVAHRAIVTATALRAGARE